MEKLSKKQKILTVAAFVLCAATVIFLFFGIRASVLKNRSADFTVDVSDKQVAVVYSGEGYSAVGTSEGIVYCYDENQPEIPVFSYDSGGADIKTLAISGERLYVAFGNRNICAFPLTSSDGVPDAVYQVGLMPERMYFEKGADVFAVYSASSNHKGVYFLPTDGTGNISYRDYSYIDQNTGLGDGFISLTIRGDSAYFTTEIATVKTVRIDGGAIRDADVSVIYTANKNLYGIASLENGFAAIDKDGLVRLFDLSFNFIDERQNKTGALSTVFVAEDVFVCKLKNGGITGIDAHRGIIFSIPSGLDALIVYSSPDSFAFLNGDGGAFRYYTLEQARSVQLNKKLALPFILTGALLLLVTTYVVVSIFTSPRQNVNGFIKKVGFTLYKHKFAYLSLLPTFALLAIFYWYPIVYSLFMSFFDYLPGEYVKFVGIENFLMVFSNTEYWKSFGNTLIFLASDLVKALLPPIIFAECLLALRSKRTSYFIRVLLFLPGILPGVASMLVWADGIFGSSSSGLLNGFFTAVMPSWVSRAWLMNNKTALSALLFMNFPWVGSYLIFFGAVSGIGSELGEAAKLDGCGWRRRILSIDIPLIFPQIKYIFIQTFISSVQNYTLILIMTGGDYGTNTPALMMYYATAVQRNYGVASAMGLILLLFLMTATIVNFKMQIGGGSRKKNVN